MSQRDLVFHLLDLQARDIRIEKEDENVRECVYESDEDESDDELGYKHKKKQYKASNQHREFVIHLFGATEEGKPLRVDVTGFRPTIYLKLPLDKPKAAAQCIKEYLNNMDFATEDLTFKIIERKIFYGFTANTYYPFLQIDMPSLTLYRNLRSLFLDEKMNYVTKGPLPGIMRGKVVEVYEANIDPMLRFIHTQNIQPCGWISIKNGMSYIQDKTASMWIIECDYTDINPTKGPRVSAPFLTASWDIECFSMTGDFPLAKRTWKKAAKDSLLIAKNGEELGDLIIHSLSTGQTPVATLPKGMTPIYCQLKAKSLDIIRNILEKPSIISSIDECLNDRNGNINERVEMLEKILDKYLKNYIKLVGDPVIQIGITLTRGTPDTTERHLFVYPDCDPIPGIQVHSYKTEKQMIISWFDWMIEKNPDILIGYNVFGFDERYLWERADELGIINSNATLHGFSRLNDTGSEVKLEENFLSSSAMGDNWLYIWSTHGRLQIDLYHYIKRGYVLPSYKLDEVTKNFMSGKIKGQRYEASEERLYLDVAGAIKDVKPGRAITLLDDTGETVSDKLVVDSIDGATISFKCSLNEEDILEMEDATKWVIVKDDVSPQDIFRLHRDSSAGRAIVGKYCLQDCDLVLELYKKLETFNNSMSMSNVCSVPISYIFKRGQGIKIESLIFKACKERDILIPVLQAPKQRGEGGEDSYEGAIVLDPVPGFYSQSPIGVCDFASLYPSTIVSENISHDSLVWVKDYDYNGKLIANYWGSDGFDDYDGYAYTDIEYDIWRPDPHDTRKSPRKVKCGRRICRYAQPLDGSKSTLPQITTWLLQAREAKKKEMKGEKDPERYALLDAEQLAYKLTGNSLYGQLGSGTFKIRLQALAASVTAYGRKQIMFAKAAIEKFYGPEANDPRVAVKAMAKVVYGDSVTGDTPLLIKNYSELNIITIEDLFNNHTTSSFEHHDTKNAIELNNCEIWTEYGWTKIKLAIKHKLAPTKKLFRIITESGEVDVTEDHSLILANGVEIKPTDVKVGTELLHSGPIIDNSAGINVLSTGKKVDKYIRFFQRKKPMLYGNKILSIEELPHPGIASDAYVYDLETENHHFGVGPGALIVHNTDSLFVEFNVKNPETGERLQGRDARQATIEITDEAGALITKALAAPHDFEFDKAFDPMLMFSKKRYAGNMYENNADDYVHKYMGIALKRRDNAPIVKTIFGGAMKMLLNDRDVVGAFKFVKDSCLDLVDGKVSFGQLVVTKSLRADYANPLSIAHKVLADRITARDPGNAPAAGDRIGYVHVCPKAGHEVSKLQGDRIETPLFIKEHGLVPDYKHYIERQLQNPISQMFGILLEQIPGFNTGLLKGCPSYPSDSLDEESYKKALDQYLGWRENEAAKLLFSDCLKRFETTSRRSAMANFFGPNSKVTITEKKPLSISTVAKCISTQSTVTTSTVTTSTAIQGITKEKKQATMSNYLLDSYLVESLKKKESAAKAKLKADAKAKANANKETK
jgi:DNA polymerase elongation subunit (family B)